MVINTSIRSHSVSATLLVTDASPRLPVFSTRQWGVGTDVFVFFPTAISHHHHQPFVSLSRQDDPHAFKEQAAASYDTVCELTIAETTSRRRTHP